MKSGDRVYVKSFMHEGNATILDIVECNYRPVQVEMDIADEDGHKVKRFACSEVTEGEKIK